MAKQTMTQAELDQMVAAMERADVDWRQDDPEVEIVDEWDDPDYEDDGQPDEYTEWQDLYGGDDWDQGQFDDF
jgi:hypothetical protein